MTLAIITTAALFAMLACLFLMVFEDDYRERVGLALWIGVIGGSLAVLYWVVAVVSVP